MNLVWMSALKRITESGVSYAEAKSEKRNIVLTNYISLVAAGATLSLLIGRFLFAHVNFSIALTLMQGCILFLLPVLLNRFGFINVSRLALCWLPPAYQLYATLQTMKEVSEFETSTYVGLRFFILAFSCFPFLVFDLRRKSLFIPGLLGPIVFLLFFDPILTVFGVGYWQMGLHDPTYQFNTVRAFISVLIIGSSSFFLKRLVGQSEELNNQLIDDLADKNKVIQQQAADEVQRLNQKLLTRLQQSADRELILNQSQRIAKIGSWEYRPKDTLLFLSDEMYNIFGLDRTFNFKTTHLPEIWGEQSAILTHATLELIRTGAPYDLTLKVRTPLGYVKSLRFYGFPLREGDTVIGAMGICHDITLYKEAEELLRTRENKYRSLFEQASDFIMILDFNGNFIDANASLCTAFGYSKEELMGLRIEALIDPEQLKEQPIRYKELDRGDHVFSHRRMMYKDGTIIDVEANVKKTQEGRMLVIARDVTELRKVQKQVEISEAKFRGAFEYSAIGMALVSLDGKWLKVNRELCHIVGYPEDQLLSLTFQDVTHPNDLGADIVLQQRALRGEIESFRMEKRYIHKNGSTVWINLNVALIRDGEGNPLHFASQVEDITERKASDRELAEANKKVGELKLVALRSVMSPHFIFNVLNSIQFFIAKNDRLNAINYLSTFSKLMRSILTHSVTNKISLAEEIEMLKNYVQLEMARFEDKFNFVLQVDPEVDIDGIEIPSLLIQPYVENAILHGLYNKDTPGTLVVRIHEQDEAIIFEIEDNGVGREAAMKISHQNFPAHKSMGIQLTEERLKLINQQQRAAFEIEDLVSENRACGTRVRIRVPF
jgi:PAS domain S-box-containing protein